MPAYYNEFDPYAAQWLRNLISAGLIAPGDVDERDIWDVRPDDLAGFAQCHFFAGIGGWSLALRLSGWPDNRPVWTGSCPCQPFSTAGKGAGFADERHHWPAFFHLIDERRPPLVLGEQVSGKRVGPWLDLVQDDVESIRYAFRATMAAAACFGAAHIRERTYWLAYANQAGRRAEESSRNKRDRASARRQESASDAWQRLHGPDWQAFASSFCSDADGDSARLPQLRAIANAIVVPQAQAFVEAVMEYAP